MIYCRIVQDTWQGFSNTSVTTIDKISSSGGIKIYSTSTRCVDQICLSALSNSELVRYKTCEINVQMKTNMSPIQIKPSCSFMNGVGRNVVALVSETGSGNTWVRGLLEKATGICTGTIYCDPALRNAGMIGEFVVGSSVLVVKTHTPDYQWEGVPHLDRESDPHYKDGFYGSAIILTSKPI